MEWEERKSTWLLITGFGNNYLAGLRRTSGGAGEARRRRSRPRRARLVRRHSTGRGSGRGRRTRWRFARRRLWRALGFLFRFRCFPGVGFVFLRRRMFSRFRFVMWCRGRFRGGSADRAHPFTRLEKQLLLFLFRQFRPGDCAGEDGKQEESGQPIWDATKGGSQTRQGVMVVRLTGPWFPRSSPVAQPVRFRAGEWHSASHQEAGANK